MWFNSNQQDKAASFALQVAFDVRIQDQRQGQNQLVAFRLKFADDAV